MLNVVVQPDVRYPELELPLDGRYQVIQVLADSPWRGTYLAQDLRRPSQPNCLIQHLRLIPQIPDYLVTVETLFAQEAALLEELGQHDQMPQLLACFNDAAGVYVVYEFILGVSLAQELEVAGCLTPEQVVRLLVECLEPLAFAHRYGVRHGQLTPANLIRRSRDGRLVLVNFQTLPHLQELVLVARGQEIPRKQHPASFYQAPEQRQAWVTPASDVYALGLIGVQALTGLSPDQLAHDPLTGNLIWPVSGLPESDFCQGVRHILNQMVQADETQRYPSAEQALQAVRYLLAGERPTESPIAAEWVDFTPEVNSVVSERRSLLPEIARFSTAAGVGASLALVLTMNGLNPLQSVATGDRGERLLADATSHYQRGKLDQALRLARSVPSDSPTYRAAQTAVSRWQADWQRAERQVQAAEQAWQANQWVRVIRLGRQLPAIDYWQQRLAPLLQQAISKLEETARHNLQQAFHLASQRSFPTALAHLRQIPPESALYALAQDKIGEYTRKQEIWAVANLQQAFDRAAQHQFAAAIPYLQTIPAEAPSYAIAQRKLTEYRQKQALQEQMTGDGEGLNPALNPGDSLREISGISH